MEDDTVPSDLGLAFDEVIDDLNEKKIFNGITHLEKTWKALFKTKGTILTNAVHVIPFLSFFS